ncbi:LCP family protein [Streptomyces bathyalis]|uniref:LCP family protein n=1 Tax=Streptomyces bathyalis TaxID=2710756 RepID=A0A7T1T7K8_9ACTN|nr:LCP family protein [Streptomyces bathyalis]QPP07862.1 LCP family protein [Streptomyces bathyalis]
MSDWLDGRHDGSVRGGESGAARIIPGQVWRRATYPAAAPAMAPPQPPGHIRPQGAAPVPPGIPPQFDDSSGADRGADYQRGRRSTRDRPSRRRRIARMMALVVAVVLASSIGTYVWADTRLNRDVDLGKVPDRPPRGKGTNYLIVGSDSRQGLSSQAKKDLHTGTAEGSRTDSMILLHTGAHGTTMTSLPRDSWTTIPSFIRPDTGMHYPPTRNKLNAAFSYGGPRLLVRAVERNTGLRIDHYAEIGFAGFVGIVDAVGGVDMCLERDVKDKKSGVDLKKGCQTLDGAQALAFVRQRHQEAQGDLGRNRNQQKLLTALARKAASPSTMLDPSTVYSALGSGLDTLVVDKDTDPSNLTLLFRALQAVTAGNGKRVNIPVADRDFTTSKGSAVLWERAQSRKLFTQLRNDQPVTFKAER